jgi:hypothetical protein
MSDASQMKAAVFSALNGDPTLQALMPDGAWWNQAPPGKTQFIIVALPGHEDLYEFQDEAFERFTYQITARSKEASSLAVDAAAARIRLVIEGMTSATGYLVTAAERIEAIAYSDPDPVDAALLWQHAGGLYEILAQPTIA